MRDASPETLIIANGFSCKNQIEAATQRRALHLAQVLAMARESGPEGVPGPHPERAYVGVRPEPSPLLRVARVAAVFGLGALALGSGAFATARALR